MGAAAAAGSCPAAVHLQPRIRLAAYPRGRRARRCPTSRPPPHGRHLCRAVGRERLHGPRSAPTQRPCDDWALCEPLCRSGACLEQPRGRTHRSRTRRLNRCRDRPLETGDPKGAAPRNVSARSRIRWAKKSRRDRLRHVLDSDASVDLAVGAPPSRGMNLGRRLARSEPASSRASVREGASIEAPSLGGPRRWHSTPHRICQARRGANLRTFVDATLDR